MWSKAFLLAFLGFAQISAQLLDPDQVRVLWSAQIEEKNLANSQGVGRGNCAILSPNQKYLITTSIRGTVTAYDALKGDKKWDYDPTVDGGTILRSHSCVVFPPNAVDPYMVYSVVQNENSVNAATRVIALDMDGNELWGSVALEGVAAGSPVCSSDDDKGYVFLTTNSESGTVGNFFVLSAASGGAEFYKMSNMTSPFSPPGIYHSPDEGHYMEGKDNTNDIIVWSVAPKPDDDRIGSGEIFGFQFPVGFSETSTGEDVSYIQLGSLLRDFQTNTPPVLTNFGRSMFWGVSRSSFRAWVGSDSSPGLDRYRFDGAPRFSKKFEFNEDFRGEPVFATPALSSDPLEPFMFGGSSSTQFVKQSWDFDVIEEVVITTSSLVKTSAKINTEDTFVYYIESANGRVHQAAFDDLSDRFTINLNFEVEGEFALSENGSVLYVASTNGNITALLLSELPETPSPTASPTVTASVAPTIAPTAAPTKAPTAAPTMAPTAVPTVAPTPVPTVAPTTMAPVTIAVVADTPAPTPLPTGITIESVAPTMESKATQTIPMLTMALVAVVSILFL